MFWFCTHFILTRKLCPCIFFSDELIPKDTTSKSADVYLSSALLSGPWSLYTYIRWTGSFALIATSKDICPLLLHTLCRQCSPQISRTIARKGVGCEGGTRDAHKRWWGVKMEVVNLTARTFDKRFDTLNNAKWCHLETIFCSVCVQWQKSIVIFSNRAEIF